MNRVCYLATSNGSGPVYRGLAFYKAWVRAGNNPKDFSLVVGSPYSYLLKHLAAEANLYLTDNGNINPQTLLDRHISQINPTHLIANQFVTNNHDIKQYLVLRQSTRFNELLEDFKPEEWKAVFAIEPGISGEIAKYTQTCWECWPVLAVWPDELLPEDEARKKLLSFGVQRNWNIQEPLDVVAHNGVTKWEMLNLVNAAYGMGQKNWTIWFTQGAAFGFHTAEPLAKCFNGIDRMIAAPGYNLFWEWQKYGREGATVKWFPQDRVSEDQNYRLNLKINRDELRKAPNGADVIIKFICRDI